MELIYLQKNTDLLLAIHLLKNKLKFLSVESSSWLRSKIENLDKDLNDLYAEIKNVTEMEILRDLNIILISLSRKVSNFVVGIDFIKQSIETTEQKDELLNLYLSKGYLVRLGSYQFQTFNPDILKDKIDSIISDKVSPFPKMIFEKEVSKIINDSSLPKSIKEKLICESKDILTSNGLNLFSQSIFLLEASFKKILSLSKIFDSSKEFEVDKVEYRNKSIFFNCEYKNIKFEIYTPFLLKFIFITKDSDFKTIVELLKIHNISKS